MRHLLPPILACVLARGAFAQLPRTAPERTNYHETTRYDEALRLLQAADRASTRVHLTQFGYSLEGRPLPLVVVGAAAATSEAVRRTGRLRVFIQANIHAGEVEGKEAMLQLVRELAQGRHARWLDSLVLLIAPIYNADGNERVLLTNRPLQDGPLGGMGQRPNAQGLDLNRDHTKLESPEARSLVALFNAYDPHVVIDLHTTNGSHHGYHLTYSPPLHPGTDSALVRFLRESLLPRVTERIRRRDGWEYFYYGNVPGGAGVSTSIERGWYTFDHRPRFNNNYVGLRNRLAILSEAYAYLSFADRIRATYRFVQEVLDALRASASEVRALTEAADRGSVVGSRLPLRAEYRRGDTLDILMGAVDTVRNPYSGQRILRRRDETRTERMPDFSSFEGREWEVAPAAYLIPPTLEAVVARLEAHGISVGRLEAPLVTTLERFRVDSTWTAPREFQGHRERTVRGEWESVLDTVPAGFRVVRLDQPLGRLAFYLLEPRSDDGLLTWNFLDEQLAGARYYPIVRTRTLR
ncbi:MAG TPA: M14 family metallopeptidase [Gemmatimonadales bacterium]|nr:M14 family metallopeptidase [Gemmatimonadales bacterium]